MKALTGVMLIVVCTMTPSSIILPQKDLSLSIIPLQSNWQIQGLLLISLLCGPQIGTVSAISYLIIGLFYLPVFHGGGSVGYILTHEFGYLLGFIPAAWTCGYLATKRSKPSFIDYSLYTILSLFILHFTGIIYLILVNLLGASTENLFNIIFINTFMPFPTQLLLCLSISLLSIFLKRILIIK
tara:strand:- start:773 stop:1324 length:552 start_codon:yes stop_codon:yes gene_type:complete